MKNINYVINGVLAIAVIILFVMQFSGKKQAEAPSFSVADSTVSGSLPIAYVNVDSLLTNYIYAKDLREIIVKKQENARVSVMQKARALDVETQDFQKKIENNAFLTKESYQQQQARLLKKRQELEEFDNRLAQDLMEEQQKTNEQLRDTLVAQIKLYNKNKGYQIIFSNTMGDNILWAADSYDITADLIDFLNKNYAFPIEK